MKPDEITFLFLPNKSEFYLTIVFSAEGVVIIRILGEIVRIVFELGGVDIAGIRRRTTDTVDATATIIPLHFSLADRNCKDPPEKYERCYLLVGVLSNIDKN
jgi:hypothetical protein